MTATAEFDICNGEERIMAFESFDMAVSMHATQACPLAAAALDSIASVG
jgi:hypothetical protein